MKVIRTRNHKLTGQPIETEEELNFVEVEDIESAKHFININFLRDIIWPSALHPKTNSAAGALVIVGQVSFQVSYQEATRLLEMIGYEPKRNPQQVQ